MKRADFMRLCGRVAARWPHSPWTDDAAAAYYDEDVKDLDGDQVATALRAWYRDQERFPPNGAQLRAKVFALSIDAPDWSAVKARLCRPPRRDSTPWVCPFDECDGTSMSVDHETNTSWPCRCREQRIAKAKGEQAHPLIREFADEVGPEALRDVWADRTAEAQVRTMWEQFVARHAQEAAYAGLPDAGLPAIERANRKGFGRIGEAIRAVLPAGTGQA